jgi:hypothetical protein
MPILHHLLNRCNGQRSMGPHRLQWDADHLTAAQLDMTPAEVRAQWPWAVERAALDGSSCWHVHDLKGGEDVS